MTQVALVDNYDSFTYNLVQYLAELGAEPHVFRNDEVTVQQLGAFEALVVSPGPGRPDDAGISVEAIKQLSGKLPVLGVCLGHQCIARAFDARVIRGEPVHGKTAQVRHDGSIPLRDVPQPFEATRYHSLVVERSTLRPEIVVSAWTDDGVVMGLRHREHPTFGVQFHPESVMTPQGRDILRAFLELA